MLSTKRTFETVDSNKIDRSTGAVISVALVCRVLIPSSWQQRGVKWYIKISELYFDVSVYNSFIYGRRWNQINEVLII